VFKGLRGLSILVAWLLSGAAEGEILTSIREQLVTNTHHS